MAERVFLDACVLYPPLVRNLVLSLAAAGRFVPAWSPRVLDEWALAVVRKQGPGAEAPVIAARARMAEAFPTAEVAPNPALETALELPDPADRHVLAGAVAAHAGVLLTFNLRDFPARALAAHGLVPRHPDGFLWEHSDSPGAGAAISAVLAEFEIAPDRARAALKRARLARFGKAWAARA